jgi:hypothetical protein
MSMISSIERDLAWRTTSSYRSSPSAARASWAARAVSAPIVFTPANTAPNFSHIASVAAVIQAVRSGRCWAPATRAATPRVWTRPIVSPSSCFMASPRSAIRLPSSSRPSMDREKPPKVLR